MNLVFLFFLKIVILLFLSRFFFKLVTTGSVWFSGDQNSTALIFSIVNLAKNPRLFDSNPKPKPLIIHIVTYSGRVSQGQSLKKPRPFKPIFFHSARRFSSQFSFSQLQSQNCNFNWLWRFSWQISSVFQFSCKFAFQPWVGKFSCKKTFSSVQFRICHSVGIKQNQSKKCNSVKFQYLKKWAFPNLYK